MSETKEITLRSGQKLRLGRLKATDLMEVEKLVGRPLTDFAAAGMSGVLGVSWRCAQRGGHADLSFKDFCELLDVDDALALADVAASFFGAEESGPSSSPSSSAAE